MKGSDLKFLVLGTGLMGRAIVEDLAEQEYVSKIVANDLRPKAVENCIEQIGREKVEGATIDVTETQKLVDFITQKDFDVIINALPPSLSVPTLNACVEANIDAVDLTFEENQMLLDEKAREKGITLISGCGVAPGLSNILAGYGVQQLDETERISIKVGGLPVEPKPPLGYKVVFHLESVWREYTRPAKVVRNQEIKEIPPLSGVEAFNFPKITQDLECFYTRGITTLPQTFDEVQEIEEKTIRYEGHAAQIKTLIECGLLDTEEEIQVQGVKISPRAFLTKLLTPKLTMEEGERDLTVMRVAVSGTEDGERKRYSFELLDYYDEEKNTTSMARTTGYTGSIVAQLVGKGGIKRKGLIKPEKLGQDIHLFQEIKRELAKRGITIQGISSS